MSKLEDFARKEMKLAGLYDKDADYGGMIPESVLKLITAVSENGDSEGSRHLTVALFKKLALYEPLGPLTGDDAEWMDVSEHGQPGVVTFQNIRCSHVFKEDGEAYDIQGRVFRDPHGGTYTNFHSRVPVTFPYTPTVEYVDVAELPEDFPDELLPFFYNVMMAAREPAPTP